MEALFRKQFWAVNLVFLALCAYLLARGSVLLAAWHFLGKLARTEAVAAARAPMPTRDARPGLSTVDEESNMFGAKVEVVEVVTEAARAEQVRQEEAKKKAMANADPVPTTLRLKLAGVTWFDREEFSLASITDLATNNTQLYSINACPPRSPEEEEEEDEELNPDRRPCNKLLDVHTVLEIEPQRVVFENATANRKEFLALLEDPPPAPPGPGGAAPAVAQNTDAPAEGPELGKGIVKVSDNQYKVPQADIDEVMANMNSVATQARIVPAFENGKSSGFKLFSIKPGSVFGKIGIQNGDVISKINGYDMSSPDKALEVYAKLKDSKEISVELKRRGQNMNMNYSIQ